FKEGAIQYTVATTTEINGDLRVSVSGNDAPLAVGGAQIALAEGTTATLSGNGNAVVVDGAAEILLAAGFSCNDVCVIGNNTTIMDDGYSNSFVLDGSVEYLTVNGNGASAIDNGFGNAINIYGDNDTASTGSTGVINSWGNGTQAETDGGVV